MKRVVVMFVDALGYDLITKKNMPFTYGLAKSGIHKKLNTIIGYTAGIYPSFLTSMYPEDHGKWSAIARRAKPKKSNAIIKSIGKLPRFLMIGINFLRKKLLGRELNHAISPLIEHLFEDTTLNKRKKILKINKYPTVFGLVKNSQYFYNYHIKDLEFNYDPNSMLDIYYILDLDHFCHLNLKSEKKMAAKLKELDEKIKEMYDFYKERDPNFDFIIMSDHGQAKNSGKVRLMPKLKNLSIEPIKDYLVILDSTMARFWVNSEKSRKEIESLLKSLRQGKLLSKKDKIKYHINFKHSLYGDIIYVVKDGFEIFPNMYHSYFENFVHGLHGYLPEDKSMKGIFIYNGSKKLKIKKEINMVDITPTILKILGKKVPSHMRGKAVC